MIIRVSNLLCNQTSERRKTIMNNVLGIHNAYALCWITLSRVKEYDTLQICVQGTKLNR